MADKKGGAATMEQPQKKARKPRSNDRRDAIKRIREAVTPVIVKANPGHKVLGFVFSFTDEGQGLLYAYHVNPESPTTVKMTTFKDGWILKAAQTAKL